MTRWVIEVRRKHDEVLVIVERDRRFFDEAGFHPSEREELRRYLYSIVDKIVNEVTG